MSDGLSVAVPPEAVTSLDRDVLRLPVSSGEEETLTSRVMEPDSDAEPRERLMVTGVAETLIDQDSDLDRAACDKDSVVLSESEMERDLLRSSLLDGVEDRDAEGVRDVL